MSNHDQSDDKVQCEGDPADADPVHIVFSDSDELGDGGARIYFDGEVALGTTFDASAALAGESRFKANSYVHITDGGGTVIQFLNFHTSCSQTLTVGNQFGSLLLEEFIPE